MTQEEIANRNRSTTDGFTSEFYHIFKGKATLLFYKLLQEHEQNEAIHLYHFYSISYRVRAWKAESILIKKKENSFIGNKFLYMNPKETTHTHTHTILRLTYEFINTVAFQINKNSLCFYTLAIIKNLFQKFIYNIKKN